MENSVISKSNHTNDSPIPTLRGSQNHWVFDLVIVASFAFHYIPPAVNRILGNHFNPVSAQTPHQKTCMMHGLARWPAHNCGPESK